MAAPIRRPPGTCGTRGECWSIWMRDAAALSTCAVIRGFRSRCSGQRDGTDTSRWKAAWYRSSSTETSTKSTGSRVTTRALRSSPAIAPGSAHGSRSCGGTRGRGAVPGLPVDLSWKSLRRSRPAHITHRVTARGHGPAQRGTVSMLGGVQSSCGFPALSGRVVRDDDWIAFGHAEAVKRRSVVLWVQPRRFQPPARPHVRRRQTISQGDHFRGPPPGVRWPVASLEA